MKRLLVTVIMMFTVLVPLSVSHAINLDLPNPHQLADYMLESTEVYLGSRMGAEYFDELDALALSVYEKLPESLDIEPVTIDSYMRQEFEAQGYDWDAFVTLLGDYMAAGIEFPEDDFLGDDPYFTFVAEITDRQATIDALLALVTPLDTVPPNIPERDDFLVYEDVDFVVYATETHFVFSTHPNYILDLDTTLSDSSEYQNALTTLPADSYSGLMYVSASAMNEIATRENMATSRAIFALNPEDTGAVMIGITGLSNTVLAIDTAIQTASSPPDPLIMTDALNLLPQEADAFIVGDDLSNLYNTVAGWAQASGEEDPTEQLANVFLLMGLDFEDDVLSWMTGNYAVFYSADTASVINQLETDLTISDLTLEFGLVIEATDADLARQLADKLGQFANVALMNDDSFAIERADETDATFPYTSITFEFPNDDFLELDTIEFVVTADDNLFYLGTAGAYDSLQSGTTLAGDADVTRALETSFSNPTSLWYVNSEGVTLPTLTTTTLFVQRPLEDAELSTPQQVFDLLRSIDTIVDNQTLSTSVDENGVVRIRATMTLHP